MLSDSVTTATSLCAYVHSTHDSGSVKVAFIFESCLSLSARQG